MTFRLQSIVTLFSRYKLERLLEYGDGLHYSDYRVKHCLSETAIESPLTKFGASLHNFELDLENIPIDSLVTAKSKVPDIMTFDELPPLVSKPVRDLIEGYCGDYVQFKKADFRTVVDEGDPPLDYHYMHICLKIYPEDVEIDREFLDNYGLKQISEENRVSAYKKWGGIFQGSMGEKKFRQQKYLYQEFRNFVEALPIFQVHDNTDSIYLSDELIGVLEQARVYGLKPGIMNTQRGKTGVVYV